MTSERQVLFPLRTHISHPRNLTLTRCCSYVGRTEGGHRKQHRNCASRAGPRSSSDGSAFQRCRDSVPTASPTDRVRTHEINNFPFFLFSSDVPFAFRYREQVEKVARLRDETVRAIVKSSTEIAMFKEGISQQLKTLRDIAEAGQ